MVTKPSFFNRIVANSFSTWPPALYLMIFVAMPIVLMLVTSFQFASGNGAHQALNLTSENYQRIAADGAMLKLFAKSFIYAAVTTTLCVLLAYPLALMIARSSKKWRGILLLLAILPFWSHLLVRIYAWMMILGPQAGLSMAMNKFLALLGIEPVSLLFSPFAALICLVYVHLPFMIFPLYANLEKHDPALLDAAQECGANTWQRFWQITFPLSLPGIYAGAALVFIPTFGAFAVPDLLSGGMIGNAISQQFLMARNTAFGSALAIVLMVLAISLTGLAALFARGRRYG
jgi:spermidine/putrescine transport system permease protein